MSELGFNPAAPVIGEAAGLSNECAALASRYADLTARVCREYEAATGGDPRLWLVITALQMHEQGLANADHVVRCLRSALKLSTPAIPSWEEFGRVQVALYLATSRTAASVSEGAA